MLVGPDEFPFKVHRTTICERSKFFNAAVSTKRWTEGQENIVRLPEGSAAKFQMDVHWVYTGKLVPEVYWHRDGLDSDEEQRAYYNAYIIGDILDDSDLRTLALDTMITESATWELMPSLNTCQQVWEKTPKGSPLRAFIVGLIASVEEHSCFLGDVGELPKEFLEEMAVLFMRQRSADREDPAEFEARIRAELLPERS